ncbi:MAG: hypothetical protein NTX88_06370 [Candidatus Atribacteria bacterium]|nr:hypothetical protein [Candidatus Atribacteria bacterium]
MSMIKEELLQKVDSLSKPELEELFDHIRWLLTEKEHISEAERKELREGLEEIKQGECRRWRDIKRTDV